MKYNRILLKLSGEALEGKQEYGIDPDRLEEYVLQIIEVAKKGTQVAIVIGGGNIFRGIAGVKKGFDRVKGDMMGMLATTINSLALQSEFEANGQKAIMLTSTMMEPYGLRFSKQKALEYLQSGHVVIISGGTGNPFFTTDSAAALRAAEIEAEVLLKGTRVDGIYTADPEKDPSATKFETISFDEALDKELKVMDLTAFTLCHTNKIPIIVFDMNKKGNLKKLLEDQKIGTLVHT